MTTKKTGRSRKVLPMYVLWLLTPSTIAVELPCKHAYHTECVAMLRKFGIAQVCPLCRADLPPGPKLLFVDAIRRWLVLARRYGQGDRKPWREVHRRDRR